MPGHTTMSEREFAFTRVFDAFGAIEGLNQTLTRLQEYVTSCS
jgi:hypothetical protein